MTKNRQIPISEIREVFELLEEANALFHQPERYRGCDAVEKFADENYPKIKRLYYEVVWSWLPNEEQEKYANR